MKFNILNDNINFSNEFVKLNEIRGIFLEEALNSVSTFRNKFKEKFNDNEQVKKDAEAFGYEYLKQYIYAPSSGRGRSGPRRTRP